MTKDDRRPSFARDFPRDPALDAVVAAFVRGNYAEVRRAAAALERASEDPSVRDAAQQLARRTGPDGTMITLVVLAGLLLVYLTLYWVVRGHGAAS